MLKLPLQSLSASDLQIAADKHPATSSASAAIRYLRPILKWATQRGYVDEVLAKLQPPATVERRTRVLRADELAAILPVLCSSARPHDTAMLFMLLTLARREEVARACWQYVDLQAATWLIPAPKNKQPHVVPLSRQALTLLQNQRPDTFEPNGLVFCTASGGALGNWDRETKKLYKKTGVSGWHRHDLRRTGATMLGRMEVLPDVVEAALNHTSIRSPLAATYNQARYTEDVKDALQRLADHLDNISASAPGTT
jgi:integrase